MSAEKKNVAKPLAVLFIATIIADRLLFHIPVELLKNPQMLIVVLMPSVTWYNGLLNPTVIAEIENKN